MRKIRFIHLLFLVLMGAGLQMSGKAHASYLDHILPTDTCGRVFHSYD
ncbi:hypothetical protein [Nitrosomonas sp. JL21]|nr:hypothetical protein [Nitrosomonas sp. JL21]MBL8498853.1 hypothetical protein [Nitrosomonas sp.]